MSERFVDNGDGTVTDKHTNLMWMKNDSYLDLGQAVTFDTPQKRTALKYLKKMNELPFAGHDDWRIPSKFEAFSLYDVDQSLSDHYNMEIHIPPIFSPGCGFDTWTSNVRGKITCYVVSFGTGTGGHKEQDSSINTSVRLVRQVGPVTNLSKIVPKFKMDHNLAGGWR